jgi:transketolase
MIKTPKKPKKPMNIFLMFSSKKRLKLMKKNKYKRVNGKINIPKVGKKLGKMWKKMSDKEKKPYVIKYKKAKRKYKKKMKKYEKKMEEKLTGKKRKRKIINMRQKKSKPSHECFCCFELVPKEHIFQRSCHCSGNLCKGCAQVWKDKNNGLFCCPTCRTIDLSNQKIHVSITIF